jgi:chromosome segregation protein
MRVKRLEIQGFKSFKDKTVIHFDHCITGIVGPNGCGKSNIVDAFFWVMGEQSYKHMRGNSSEDLIFNGSSKYTPLGMAEATLVLETDVPDLSAGPAGASVQEIPVALKTKEISVTRRLYRSGEGEYFINGTLARLKDIQELFMDTGVGAKGYSVIEQGQIGKIVNAKPEERRLLIEEAAGIAKYKARKKESLRKMEATQANLSRLTDIIQEIEKNLASLERQAQKARQYKKYKDELLDKEMTWGRRKSKAYHLKLDHLKKQRDALDHELAGMRAELQIAENSIEVDRIELVTETKESETLQARIQDLSSDYSHERSALELSRRRQGDLAAQLQSLENEQEDLQVSIETDQYRLEEMQAQASEADQLFQKAASEARQLNENLTLLRKDVEKARSHLEASQRELMARMSESSHLTSKAAALLSKSESARAQVTRLNLQIESQNEKILNVQDEWIKAKETAEGVQEQKIQLQAERKEQAARLQTEEQETRRLEKSRDESLRALTQLKSRLQSLEELDQSHEGLADGPKAALDWAKSQNKGHQLVAFTDALEVSSGYESVLESWLESRIENLLIQDPSLALPLFEQITKDKQGRVGIQLIQEKLAETLSPSSPTSFEEIRSLLEQHGFQVIGQLSQFVTSKASYASLMNPLMRQVCVVESSAPMANLIQNTGVHTLSGWSLVSMDGVALEPQGVMRGGSLNASGAVGILKRKRSIEELRTQTSQSEVQHQELENSTNQAKQSVELAKARLQSLQSDLQSLEVQAAGLQRDVHQTERALHEAKVHLESLEQDAQEMTQEAERAIQDQEAIELELQELRSSHSDLEETISAAEKTLQEKETILHTHDSELQSVRVNEASLRERAVSLKRELESTRSLKADRERRLAEIRRTLERASREQEQYSGGESELTQKIEELTLALAHARDRLAEVKDRMEQSNAKVNKTLEKIKELHKVGDHKTAETNQLSLEIEKVSGELSHLVLNLEEKYGPGCLDRALVPLVSDETAGLNSDDPIPAVVTVVTPAEISAEEERALGEEVERLRERIRRLGEVNVMAIEEFEHLKKRFDHLLTEKSDLERSLENLQDAIEHINKTSEERFKKAFEAIAERFERLFPVIFGGGQAKLSLVYPEGSADILDAGVDILAQPPGKKVANITLLSGGEKALTAVSLIFAIFMVKPSPFCVLDEVDAPLDDANIGKFNALLREMSVKSQFILITHNKKTMELNDTLYGVTMEEPGVSKMISIEMHA